MSNERPAPPSRKNRWRQTALWGLRLVISRRRLLVRGDPRSPTIFLTFDDGPHPEVTPLVLDVLSRYGAKATFFVIGQQVATHPELVRRVADEGHTLGHHTFFHRHPGSVGSRQFMEELSSTDQLLHRIVGRGTRLVRPPYGKLTLGKLWRLWVARWTIVLWNQDPKDFAATSVDSLAAWFRERSPTGGDIILLHDTSALTAAVLEQVIPRAQDAGLLFAPLNQG